MICRSKYEAVIGIDTGTEQTAMVVCQVHDMVPIYHQKLPNAEIERELVYMLNRYRCLVAIELLENHGMPIGATTIQTIIEIGRIQKIVEANRGEWTMVKRSEEKMCICQNPRAKDGNIRQALIDMYGDKGTKKQPGFFYGFRADEWQAFAIAHTCRYRLENGGRV